MRQYKATLKLDLKSADETGIISGVANVMELVDLGGDRIKAGAFTRTLNAHKGIFPLELDHGDGIESEIGVGEFKVDGNQLLLDRGTINLGAKDIADNIYPRLKFRQEHGIPAGLSIVYGVPDGKYKFVTENGRRIRELEEIKLYKVGIVDIPMNQASYLNAVKSDTEKEAPMLKAFTDLLAQLQTRQAQDQLREDRWQMESVFESACRKLLDNEDELSPDVQRAALSDLFDQYKALYMAWFDRMVALMPTDDMPEDAVEMMALRVPIDEKAGRTISAANLSKLTEALSHFESLGACLTALQAAANSSDDTSDDDDPQKNADLIDLLTKTNSLLRS